MKTYWLIIGCSVVLTVAVVCVVGYRLSMPGSAVKPQIAPQIQKRNADKGKPVSQTMSLNPVRKPAVAPVHSVAAVPVAGKEQATRVNHRQFATAVPRMTPRRRFTGEGAIMASVLPEWMLRHQSRTGAKWDREITRRPLSDRDSGPAPIGGNLMSLQSAGNPIISTGPAVLAGNGGPVLGQIRGIIIKTPQVNIEQTGDAQSAEQSVNDDLSSRLPSELLDAPPFQHRGIASPSGEKNEIPVPDSPQRKKAQELLNRMPLRYHNLLDVVDGRVSPDFNGPVLITQTSR